MIEVVKRYVFNRFVLLSVVFQNVSSGAHWTIDTCHAPCEKCYCCSASLRFIPNLDLEPVGLGMPLFFYAQQQT